MEQPTAFQKHLMQHRRDLLNEGKGFFGEKIAPGTLDQKLAIQEMKIEAVHKVITNGR